MALIGSTDPDRVALEIKGPREIDAIVALYVLGWRITGCHEDPDGNMLVKSIAAPRGSGNPPMKPDRLLEFALTQKCQRSLLQLSNHVAGAILHVLPRFKSWSIDKWINEERYTVKVGVEDRPDTDVGQELSLVEYTDNLLALTICRVALMAKGVRILLPESSGS